jgi:hypothetical protein
LCIAPAAVASLGIVLPWVALVFIFTLDGDMADPLRLILKPLWLLAAVGMARTGMGMEYLLFRFDNSRALKQVFWFCAMIFRSWGR